jgi:hypothetical protein
MADGSKAFGGVVLAVIVGGGWFLSSNPDWLKSQLASFKPPSTELKTLTVRDLVLDGKTLMDDKAYVQVTGVYVALGESGDIYPPGHKPADSDSGFSVISEDAPREVREFFYNCKKTGQYGMAYCPVTLTGHITECFLKINKAATMPCLAAEKVVVAR